MQQFQSPVYPLLRNPVARPQRGDYNTWANLSTDERKAYQQWHDDGVIDTTQTQMLMGLAETGSHQYDPKVAKALEVTGAIF